MEQNFGARSTDTLLSANIPEIAFARDNVVVARIRDIYYYQ